MNRTIKDVRWANDRKTQIYCKYEYEDGKNVDAYISDTEQGNPDWKEIIETIGEKTLEENTRVYLKDIQNPIKPVPLPMNTSNNSKDLPSVSTILFSK